LSTSQTFNETICLLGVGPLGYSGTAVGGTLCDPECVCQCQLSIVPRYWVCVS